MPETAVLIGRHEFRPSTRALAFPLLYLTVFLSCSTRSTFGKEPLVISRRPSRSFFLPSFSFSQCQSAPFLWERKTGAAFPSFEELSRPLCRPLLLFSDYHLKVAFARPENRSYSRFSLRICYSLFTALIQPGHQVTRSVFSHSSRSRFLSCSTGSHPSNARPQVSPSDLSLTGPSITAFYSRTLPPSPALRIPSQETPRVSNRIMILTYKILIICFFISS